MTFNELVIGIPTGLLVFSLLAMWLTHHLDKVIRRDAERARREGWSKARPG